ncbi:phosphonate transport system substrate-binding protein [Amphibacillus marinus]|uniref:Phosphonate transport system substrate-binding protein n=1 Tax=Amphibacillus marinus TaxID=872970 RepID=A0A1H8LKV4_9BACI|nr:PhnD/SsuA/transferrin family substrate-binding protein [Amphibacillus marinus]SEO05781.1 phosphonate transport system substrate-binding protein [Amphibacillus marinus]
MKKKWLLLFLFTALIALLVACSDTEDDANAEPESEPTSEETNEESSSNEVITKLSVGFVPSREPDEIITATEPLKDLLITELAGLGFDVGEVDITVGTNYEAVGEALSAGTTDIGLIPGGTYVLYDDGAEVLLTSTRAGLSIDSEDPVEWNNNKPTEAVDEQVTYYRSLLIAGPSEKGQELAEKVNNGEELTFDDLNSATWAVMSSSSSAGYIYPTLWLQDKYNMKLTDLENLVQVDSYGSSFARLAAEQVDIIVAYADARRDNVDAWQGEFSREADIWAETNVIGVTSGIYNDTVSASKNADNMTAALKSAIQQAFINIAQTDEGKAVISIYSHEGYQEASDSDYDKERDAQVLLREMN